MGGFINKGERSCKANPVLPWTDLVTSRSRIKDSLKALGDGIYIGEHYEAAVYSQERTYTDWLKVVLKLKIPAKTIAKFSTKKSVICLQIREKTPS
jgi:hypothetical protein